MLQTEIKKENKDVWKNTDSSKERFRTGIIKEVFNPYEVRCSISGNFVHSIKSLYPLLEKNKKYKIT